METCSEIPLSYFWNPHSWLKEGEFLGWDRWFAGESSLDGLRSGSHGETQSSTGTPFAAEGKPAGLRFSQQVHPVAA